MSSHRKKSDFNYWPSISDMFLVFFIIALAIVVGRTLIQQAGEKMILKDVVEESNVLFDWVSKNSTGSNDKIPYYAYQITDSKDSIDCPELAARLYKTYEFVHKHLKNTDVKRKLPQHQEAIDYYMQCKENPSYLNYVKAIQLLYFTVNPQDEPLNPKNIQKHEGEKWGEHSIYDHYLSHVRMRLITLDGLPNKDSLANDTLRISQLTDSNESLRRDIEKLKEENLKLKTENLKLKAERQDPDLITKLEKKLLELEEMNKKLQAENTNLRDQNQRLKTTIDQVADFFGVKWPKDDRIQGNPPELIAAIEKDMRLVVKVLEEGDISFDLAKKDAKPTSVGKQKLDELAKAIKEKILQSRAKGEQQKYIIEIVGHTCDKGRYNKNAGLGLDRARDVGKLLQDRLKEFSSEVEFRYSSSGWLHWLPNTKYLRGEDYRSSLRRVEILVRPKQEGEPTLRLHSVGNSIDDPEGS